MSKSAITDPFLNRTCKTVRNTETRYLQWRGKPVWSLRVFLKFEQTKTKKPSKYHVVKLDREKVLTPSKAPLFS